MSRRPKRDQRTAMEKGAAMAYVAATAKVAQLTRMPFQLDAFDDRRAILREWIGIQNAALLALT